MLNCLQNICNRYISAVLVGTSIIGLTSAYVQAKSFEKDRDQAAAESNEVRGQSTSFSYLRVTEEKDRKIALEIASRSFVHKDGTGPKVGLIGMAHIADASFYQAAQSLLDEYDVVLFESVKPHGTGGAGGDTDKERIDSTKAAIEFVGRMIKTYHHVKNTYPGDLHDLEGFASEEDARLARWLNVALIDAWDKKLDYNVKDEGNVQNFELTSFGADGKTGGNGANADIHLADLGAIEPLEFIEGDNIQAKLADTLGLKFQLHGLSYDKSSWRCSDMAMDELERALTARGLDFQWLGGTLSGSSFMGKIASFILNFIQWADSFLEGALADTFKVVMIDMLGDETLVKQSIEQLGKGFEEVLIDERNQVVIDDLKIIIENEPEIDSVALLYGAAHLDDLANRLNDQLGYLPDETEWLTAIEVDYEKSALSVQELNQIRAMMKHSLRQSMRQFSGK